MVDAHGIKKLQVVEDARPPPREAIGCMRSPVVERIAPELPVLSKVVGRHARDGRGSAVGVELEELRVGSHVTTISRDVDGFVTQQANTVPLGVGA